MTAVIASRYRLDGLLGEGGMASVYFAYDRQLNRPVAIKVLHEEYGAHRQMRRRFIKEARSLARLNHENIVEVYAIEDEGPQPYIVEEYVEGIDLDEVLRLHGRLPLDRVLRHARELASALACFHTEQLVHRDIKPSNVMIDVEGRAHLLDFGLVLETDKTRMTEAGTLVGSYYYMAPEVLRGEKATAASDVFQLGTILSIMALGKPLDRNKETIIDDLKHLVNGDVPTPAPPTELPERLRKLLIRCCRKDPARRLANGSEVLAFLDDGTPDSEPSSLVISERPDRLEQRRRRRALVLRFRSWFLVLPFIFLILVLLWERLSPLFTR